MSTKNTVSELLLSIAHLPNSPFNGANVSQIVEMYYHDLQDIDDELLSAAVVHYRTGATPFFPSSGQIREKATELQLLAMGIPTAAEAWAQVQNAWQYREAVFCEAGAHIRNSYLENQTVGELREYDRHLLNCPVCDVGGFAERYDHPAVANVVKLLGGRDMLLTDNEPADRAKFFEAYNAIVKRETLKASLPTVARQFVETKQLEARQATKLLAERLSK